MCLYIDIASMTHTTVSLVQDIHSHVNPTTPQSVRLQLHIEPTMFVRQNVHSTGMCVCLLGGIFPSSPLLTFPCLPSPPRLPIPLLPLLPLLPLALLSPSDLLCLLSPYPCLSYPLFLLPFLPLIPSTFLPFLLLSLPPSTTSSSLPSFLCR